MRTRRASRALAFAIVAALVCLGSAILEESFIHTDDGCVVEIHCLACRLAASTTVVVETIGIPPVVSAPAGSVAPDVVVFVAEARPVFRPSRAPPLG